eukprot:s1814_g5.t3
MTGVIAFAHCMQIRFIFVSLIYSCWLSLNAAVRPHSADWDDGNFLGSELLLNGNHRSIDAPAQSSALPAIAEAPRCTNEEQMAAALKGFGLKGEGDPCEWRGVQCAGCTIVQIVLEEADGNLSYLSKMIGLQVLRMENTQVTGDIAALQSLTNLQRLFLYNTQVKGDIAAVQSLTNLQMLDLSQTQVKGDIAALQSLTNLWKLGLAQTQVKGDIAAVQSLPNLQMLDLYNTQVKGDIAAIQSLTNLQRLFLFNTQVKGDIAAVQSLPNLQKLYLYNTQVKGDIAAVQSLPNLWHLGLAQTQVKGDIAALQSLTNLQRLFLHNTQVKGDIAAVQSLPNLQKLYLYNTQVKGDIAALQSLTNLQMLFLYNTQVKGDIAAVQSLTNLHELVLSQTQVKGDIAALQSLAKLQKLDLHQTEISGAVVFLSQLDLLAEVDLSSTKVSGSMAGARSLRKLNVADTGINDLGYTPGLTQSFSSKVEDNWLPALQSLNVSGCPLTGSIEQLLLPFAGTSVTSIAAARCGLTGSMVDLSAVDAKVDGIEIWWNSILGQSLQVLDLSQNNLQEVGKLPAKVRMDISHNRETLALRPGVIRKAVQDSIDLWLPNTTIANRKELQQLLSSELALDKIWVDSAKSYSCRNLVAPNLRVSPDLFLPLDMCGCRPGYAGAGTNCSVCPENTFNSQNNQTRCNRCPPKSSTNQSSYQLATSKEACRCGYGFIGEKNSELICQCPQNEALSKADGELCVSCSKHHLQCPKPGATVSEAAVERGYWRRQGSEKIYQCLEAERCINSSCAEGYSGQLCAECTLMHRLSGKHCIKCSNVPLKQRMPTIGFTLAGMLGFVGMLALLRHPLQQWSSSLHMSCMMRLLALQLPILLQLVQLWVVLGRLQKPMDSTGMEASDMSNASVANATVMEESSPGDEFLSYMQAVLLTSTEIQNAFALQCLFDALTVRSIFAVATPVIPVVLLMICGFLEFCRPGVGIRMSLKILTLLYIGAASGCAQLLDCQRTDGTGKMLLDFPFRRLFPHLQCSEAKWVDWVGYACGIFYGVFIPLCLAFLFAKQRMVMRQCETFAITAKKHQGTTILHLQEATTEEGWRPCKDQKRLLGAATAHVTSLADGRAFVELKQDAVMVTFADDVEHVEDAFAVESYMFKDDKDAKKKSEVLSRNAMLRLVSERRTMEELQNDRVMLGAKDLFCKYAKCDNVWMEVCSKAAAVVLVSVVSSKDGVWLSVAVTLGMALVTGLVQPFAQPQANTLQSLGFASLALAAVGFRCRNRLPSLVGKQLPFLALSLPFLVLLAQLRRPDSRVSVALRMQQDTRIGRKDADGRTRGGLR